MAIEYRLTVAGDTPAEAVAERAIPDPVDRPTPTASGRLLSADLYDKYGFDVTVRSGQHGYYDAASDYDQLWVWEPAAYVNVTFRMDDQRLDDGQRHMLVVVARVLVSGAEDAALVLNGNWLLLSRTDGVTRKHRRSVWWDNDDFRNDTIPG